MQQGITRHDVYRPSVTATIGGRAVEVDGVSSERDLPDPLSRGALRAATVELSALNGPDVTSTVATPWDVGTQWPPVPESPVSVSMGTGDGEVSILANGRLVSAEGDSGDREIGVEASDLYETLNRTISWSAMADAVPSMQEAVIARYVGLQSAAVTDRILRHCGWYSTPPALPYSLLSVPAQGTMWPEAGTVTISSGQGTSIGYPGWLNTQWGIGASDADASYTLAGAGYTLAGRGNLELVAMTDARAGEGTSRIDVLTDGGALIARLAWSVTSGVVWLRNAEGGLTAAATVSRGTGLMYASIRYVSATQVRVVVRSGGQESSVDVTVPSIVTSSVLARARIVASSVSGGFQVAMPATAGTLNAWKPNAVLYPRPGGRNSLIVLPPVEGDNCADLLAEQCAAECATYWIDETGVLRWWDLARLEAASPVATLTSADDLTDEGFSWSHDLSQVKSRVAVDWREPLREWAWRTTVDLWQGTGSTLQPGDDPQEEWIKVPDDEVWLLPDLSLMRLGDDGTISDFNSGFGSFYGGITDDTDAWAQTSGSLLMSIERVTDSAFKTRTTWTGSSRVLMKSASPEASSSLWRRRRDFNLPIIRGKARFVFADRMTYAGNGPATAPEHSIDAGWWIQRADQAQYTADYAAARLTIPQPVISAADLIPIPGLQLGDMIEVRDEHVTRLTIRGIVIADSRFIRSALVGIEMKHAITIRPTLVTRNGVTWEEWGTVMNGRTWQTFGAEQAGKTWQDWGSAPLLGEDVI